MVEMIAALVFFVLFAAGVVGVIVAPGVLTIMFVTLPVLGAAVRVGIMRGVEIGRNEFREFDE